MAKQSRTKKQTATVEIPLKLIMPLDQMTADDLRESILLRMAYNCDHTNHPMHHKTADGTVIDTDPTLSHMMGLLTDALPTVPVDTMHYGFDLYSGAKK